MTNLSRGLARIIITSFLFSGLFNLNFSSNLSSISKIDHSYRSKNHLTSEKINTNQNPISSFGLKKFIDLSRLDLPIFKKFDSQHKKFTYLSDFKMDVMKKKWVAFDVNNSVKRESFTLRAYNNPAAIYAFNKFSKLVEAQWKNPESQKELTIIFQFGGVIKDGENSGDIIANPYILGQDDKDTHGDPLYQGRIRLAKNPYTGDWKIQLTDIDLQRGRCDWGNCFSDFAESKFQYYRIVDYSDLPFLSTTYTYSKSYVYNWFSSIQSNDLQQNYRFGVDATTYKAGDDWSLIFMPIFGAPREINREEINYGILNYQGSIDLVYNDDQDKFFLHLIKYKQWFRISNYANHYGDYKFRRLYQQYTDSKDQFNFHYEQNNNLETLTLKDVYDTFD